MGSRVLAPFHHALCLVAPLRFRDWPLLVPKLDYCEQGRLSWRPSSKRSVRLGNGFSKRLEPHCAAVSLYVSFYNLGRTHESLKCTPAMALGIADRVWTISDLIEAAFATQPITPADVGFWPLAD